MVPLQVSVLAYPGCFASEVYGIPDLLTIATHVATGIGRPGSAYEVTVVSPRHRVIASGGSRIEVSPLRTPDVLVVSGFELAPQVDLDRLLRGLDPEIDAVRAHTTTGAPVVSICVGAFVLAWTAGRQPRRGCSPSAWHVGIRRSTFARTISS